MKPFKKYLNEVAEFNDKQAIKDSEKWLNNKYGKDLYTFKNIPGMKMEGEKTKVYDIVVDGKTYQLNLKKFDSNGDGNLDTLGFDVLPSVEAEEEDEL
jgi:predicted RNA-binding protein with TRAM domain